MGKVKVQFLTDKKQTRRERTEAARRRGTFVPPRNVAQFIDAGLEVRKAMKARLKRMQLTMVPRPTKSDGSPLDPLLPPDLTRLNDVQLGRLYGEFCSMSQYVLMELAVQSVRKALAEHAERFFRSKAWLEQRGTVGDKESAVEMNEEVQRRSVTAIKESSLHTLKEALLQRYTVGKETTSRELTRRQITYR